MAGVCWVAVVAGLGGWGVPIWFSLMLRVSLFSGFSSSNSILFRVLIVGICDPQNLLFILRKNTNQTPQKSLRISPYSPIFGEFLNSGNTSLIGEPSDWEGA